MLGFRNVWDFLPIYTIKRIHMNIYFNLSYTVNALIVYLTLYNSNVQLTLYNLLEGLND